MKEAVTKGGFGKEVLKLLASVALCFGISGIGAIFSTNKNITGWYAELQKPAFTPPDWVFGPVWICLYLMLGVSAYLVWRKGWKETKVKTALCIFVIQLLLNAAWTPVFFGFHLIGTAFIEIILLMLAIIATIIAFKRVSRRSAILLMPYLIWVGFATVLNGTIWYLNH